MKSPWRSKQGLFFGVALMNRFQFDLEGISTLSEGFPLHLSLQSDLAQTLIQLRAIQTFDTRAMSYAIQRTVRCAARRPIDELFDDLALHMGMTAHRVDATSLLLDAPGVFISASGRRKIDYSSLTFDFWADTLQRLECARDRMLRLVGEQLARREIFTIDWHFHQATGLSSASFDEMADPQPFSEAYPTLGEPVAAFVARYLASREAVLILQGPPGTGKTRLVRAILAALSARKGDSARVLYTADQRALDNDEIFVEFITGSHDAFVIEDADHLLMARANGNVELHRFLAIADGVVRAQGRKIIFTTNLPNVGDIDDALVRPGRCFATVRTRALEPGEATALAARLGADSVIPAGLRPISLAAFYKLIDDARAAAPPVST
jgi:hypothetical protein